MDMIGHTSYPLRESFQAAHRATEVIMQTKAPGCVDGWHAVFGAEDEVIMQTEIGRCHNISSLNLARVLWHPCGVRGWFLPRSGGVVALNHGVVGLGHPFLGC